MIRHTQGIKYCYIVSLKYSPGLAKEFVLLGENLRKCGWTVKYILSSGYKWILAPLDLDVTYLVGGNSLKDLLIDTARFFRYYYSVREMFERFSPEFVLVYNTHPFNSSLVKLASDMSNQSIRSVYLHEPFVPDKSTFGTIRSLYIELAEKMQSRTLRHINHIILPSHYAQSLFDQGYAEYGGRKHVAPILLSDLPNWKSQERKYFSFVGNINRSRSLEDFINLMNFVAERNGDQLFKIVTRSNISSDLAQLSTRAKERLTLINKSSISDQELSDTVQESYAIFLLHKHATQSGNIPIAFRSGTPVIARNIPGLAQHVETGRNGYLIPYESNSADLYKGMKFIEDNFDILSNQARADFENVFSEDNWEKYYSWLIR